MKKSIVLLGAGGHCRVVVDALRELKAYRIAAILGTKRDLGCSVMGIPVCGTDADLKKHYAKGARYCFIAVGSIGNPRVRQGLAASARAAGYEFPSLISPSAAVSRHASIGEGTYAGPASVINAGASVGRHCIINSGCVIEHDCVLGDFVHAAPNSAVGGGARIGEGAHIGIGSVVIQGMTIGAYSTIGAGSVVTRDIAGKVIAFGNPCRVRGRNGEKNLHHS